MNRIWGTALIAVLALTGAGVAWAAADKPIQLPLEGDVQTPDWRKTPSGDDFAREYPQLASKMMVEGRAVISCAVEADGLLDECKIDSEAPAGFGFGAAALRISPHFVMNPAKLDGVPVKSKVTVPLSFKLGGDVELPKAVDFMPTPTSPAALDLARKIVEREHYVDRLHLWWRSTLQEWSAEVVSGSQPEAAATVQEALRQGMEDTVQQQLDLIAHQMAARMGEADLRAALAFLDSPAGVAYTGMQQELSESKAFNGWAALARAARVHLCGQPDCQPAATAKAATP